MNPTIVVARLLREAKARAGTEVTAACFPWSLSLLQVGTRRTFRAQLLTRGSTVLDWTLLGRLTALVGSTAQRPESIETDPTAVHEWIWEI